MSHKKFGLHIFPMIIISVQNHKSISSFFQVRSSPSLYTAVPISDTSDSTTEKSNSNGLLPGKSLGMTTSLKKRENIGYFISTHMPFWSDKTTMLIFLVFNFTYYKVNESVDVSECTLQFFFCADVLHVDKREYRRCLIKFLLGAVLLFFLLVIVGFIIPVYIKGFPVPVRGEFIYLCIVRVSGII